MACFAWICLIQFILFYSLCLYSFVKHWEPNSTLSAQIHILVSSLITPKKTILLNCSVCYLLHRCNCFHATHKYLCKLQKDGIIWTWSSCVSISVVAASQNDTCSRIRPKFKIMREGLKSDLWKNHSFKSYPFNESVDSLYDLNDYFVTQIDLVPKIICSQLTEWLQKYICFCVLFKVQKLQSLFIVTAWKKCRKKIILFSFLGKLSL